jgi:hypothetical protein
MSDDLLAVIDPLAVADTPPAAATRLRPQYLDSAFVDSMRARLDCAKQVDNLVKLTDQLSDCAAGSEPMTKMQIAAAQVALLGIRIALAKTMPDLKQTDVTVTTVPGDVRRDTVSRVLAKITEKTQREAQVVDGVFTATKPNGAVKH